jgi:hypothetical protein
MSQLFNVYCDGMKSTEDYVQLVRRRFANHVELPVHHGEAIAGFATPALLHGRRRWLGRGDD